MTTLQTTVRHADDATEERTLTVDRIANCGGSWRTPPTGEELSILRDAQGSDFDPTELIVTPKPAHLITTATEIRVNSATTAGEAEFVLFPTEDRTYLGVGMDHKDFKVVEGTGIHRGNSTCPSVVAPEVWCVADVSDHWDELQLRSWTGEAGERERYQEASLVSFLSPETLIDRVRQRITAPVAGTAIWAGTIGAVDDVIQGVHPNPTIHHGEYYAVELYDPVLNRRLATQYDVRLNEWIEGLDLDQES
ncbi:MAG: DUF2848 family protein [Halobacteriales archaeon]|nr:DUF2848 family protein [Halobacteriales archaeon]